MNIKLKLQGPPEGFCFWLGLLLDLEAITKVVFPSYDFCNFKFFIVTSENFRRKVETRNK